MAHPQDRRHGCLAAAIEAGLVGRDDAGATAMFMDLDILHSTIDALKRAPFPPSTLHTFAVKANPVARVMELIRDAGLGAEVASLGELRHALSVGFAPHRVVFDSPIKTEEELRFALRAGVRLNLDNLQELQRVAKLVEAEPQLLYGNVADGSTVGDVMPRRRLVGLRINPQVGEGRIAALSTAGRVSKFGIPLLECRTELLDAFANYPWINALHLHVGSQGVPMELTVEGIERVAELAAEIEAAAYDKNGGGGSAKAGRRVLALDIGGGLPVQYGNDELSWLLGSPTAASDVGWDPAAAPAATAATAAASPLPPPLPPAEGVSSIFERYAALLRQRLPSLFTGSDVVHTTTEAAVVAAAPPSLPPPQLVTEFGRCLVAKSVFAVGRVEYSKRCGGRRVVVSGLGGDLLLRAVYLPDTWPVRVELYGAAGQPKHLPCAVVGAETGLGFGAAESAAMAAAAAAEPAAAGPAALEPAAACVGCDAAAADVSTAAAAAVSDTLVDIAVAVAGDSEEDFVAPTDVVGPLCFQGDRLAEAALLPPAHPGDWIVVPDVGAYCLSMYSRYNSRCSPPVWGFRRRLLLQQDGVSKDGTAAVAAKTVEAAAAATKVGLVWPAAWMAAAGRSGGGGGVLTCGEYEFMLLRRGETVEEVMAFWSLL